MLEVSQCRTNTDEGFDSHLDLMEAEEDANATNNDGNTRLIDNILIIASR